MSVDKGFDLSDIFFVLCRENAEEYLEASVITGERYDYLPMIAQPFELQEIHSESWIMLLDLLKNQSKYERIVLDLSHEIVNVFELLNYSRYIYVLAEDNKEGHYMVSHLFKALDVLGEKDLNFYHYYFQGHDKKIIENILEEERKEIGLV